MNFSRDKLKGADVEPGEIEVVPPSVQETAMLVCAARLENSLDHNEFKGLVDELIESVRHDERMRSKLLPIVAIAPGPLQAPSQKLKLMQAEDAAEIKRLVAAATRTPAGKLPQGFANQIGARLGYTVTQVQSVIYDRGQS